MTYDEEFIAMNTPAEEPEEDFYERLEVQNNCYGDYDKNE